VLALINNDAYFQNASPGRLIVQFKYSAAVLLVVFAVAVMIDVLLATTVGVPEIIPVEVFIDNPVGNPLEVYSTP
jgi:hypothetical protein